MTYYEWINPPNISAWRSGTPILDMSIKMMAEVKDLRYFTADDIVAAYSKFSPAILPARERGISEEEIQTTIKEGVQMLIEHMLNAGHIRAVSKTVLQ